MKDMKTEEVKLRSFEEYLDKKVNAKQRWLLNNFGVRDWCEHANGHCSQQVTAATADIKRERDEYYDTLQQHRVTIAEMQRRIEELEAMIPKWVWVGDRLPKTGVSVLMLDPNLHIQIGYYIGNDRWDTFNQKRLISITHWMPLPKPLK